MRSTRRKAPVGTRATASRCVLTSTGIASLDDMLGGGLAMGSILLIKEDRFSQYAKLILQYAVAQGLAHSHSVSYISLEETLDPQQLMAIVVSKSEVDESDSDEFVPQMSGVSAGYSARSNLGGGIRRNNNPGDTDNMKIAWRYQNLPKLTTGLSIKDTASSDRNTKIYTHQFDLSRKIAPQVLQNSKLHLIDESQLLKSSLYEDLLKTLNEVLIKLPVEYA